MSHRVTKVKPDTFPTRMFITNRDLVHSNSVSPTYIIMYFRGVLLNVKQSMHLKNRLSVV